MTPTDFLLARPSTVRYGVLGFACSLSLITYLDRVCIMRARADIQNELGFSDTQMGWVFFAFVLGYTLFEVPGGWMGDRWGGRRVLTRIVLTWSFFTALTGLVWAWEFSGIALGLAAMLAVRFLFGVGEAGAYPTLTRITGDWFPQRERAIAQGGIWTAARIGGAIAPIVLGRLSALLGWRQAFFVLGGVGIVWAWLFWRWYRDRPALHPDCNEAERHHIESGSPPHSDHGHTWPSRADIRGNLGTMLALCSASFWVCFGWYFYPTWQPKYLEDVHHYKPTGWMSELLTGLPFLCGAVGAMAGGLLSDRLVRIIGPRWGRSAIGLVGFIGAGICVTLTGFVTSTWQAVTLLCLAFLINDLAIPVIWASCADIGGRFAGSLAGLMNMIGGFGAMLSPLLIPYVLIWLPGDFTPEQRWQVIFVGLAGAWFIAAASWLFIDASCRLGQTEPKLPTLEPRTTTEPSSAAILAKPDAIGRAKE